MPHEKGHKKQGRAQGNLILQLTPEQQAQLAAIQ